MMMLRHIFMGSEAAVNGPGLWESMEILGKDKCIRRLEYAIKLKNDNTT